MPWGGDVPSLVMELGEAHVANRAREGRTAGDDGEAGEMRRAWFVVMFEWGVWVPGAQFPYRAGDQLSSYAGGNKARKKV